jgi:hypothetical protein
MSISKLETAGRQLDCAIRLTATPNNALSCQKLSTLLSADDELPAYRLNRRSVHPKFFGYLPHPLGASRSTESSHNALLEHILDGRPAEAFALSARPYKNFWRE